MELAIRPTVLSSSMARLNGSRAANRAASGRRHSGFPGALAAAALALGTRSGRRRALLIAIWASVLNKCRTSAGVPFSVT